MARRDVVANVIADAIWAPTNIEPWPEEWQLYTVTDDHLEECYRIADAVLSHLDDGGDAAPPAATTGVGAPAAAECATTTAAPPSQTGPGPAEVIGGQPGPVARRFVLFRHRDISGVSGVGVVAEGVQFSDGSVALRWPGADPSTAVWPTVESVLKIHGHSGATEARWLDGGESS